jgi:hypothetical protein
MHCAAFVSSPSNNGAICDPSLQSIFSGTNRRGEWAGKWSNGNKLMGDKMRANIQRAKENVKREAQNVRGNQRRNYRYPFRFTSYSLRLSTTPTNRHCRANSACVTVRLPFSGSPTVTF